MWYALYEQWVEAIVSAIRPDTALLLLHDRVMQRFLFASHCLLLQATDTELPVSTATAYCDAQSW